MHTEIVDCSYPRDGELHDELSVRCPKLVQRIAKRFMSEDDFIDHHASGTLRKNRRLKFRYKDQYHHERLSFEFGYPFESLESSRITFGDPFTEGDCKALTEAGWHIDRYISMSVFSEDDFRPKYLVIQDKDGQPYREGIGLVVWKTSAPFVRPGHIVFAIIAEFRKSTGMWLPAVNPS